MVETTVRPMQIYDDDRRARRLRRPVGVKWLGPGLSIITLADSHLGAANLKQAG